jgi:hypothetical protein
MGTIRYPETSVKDYQSTLRYTPEDPNYTLVSELFDTGRQRAQMFYMQVKVTVIVTVTEHITSAVIPRWN